MVVALVTLDTVVFAGIVPVPPVSTSATPTSDSPTPRAAPDLLNETTASVKAVVAPEVTPEPEAQVIDRQGNLGTLQTNTGTHLKDSIMTESNKNVEPLIVVTAQLIVWPALAAVKLVIRFAITPLVPIDREERVVVPVTPAVPPQVTIRLPACKVPRIKEIGSPKYPTGIVNVAVEVPAESTTVATFARPEQ
jgi:hypothetical protein